LISKVSIDRRIGVFAVRFGLVLRVKVIRTAR